MIEDTPPRSSEFLAFTPAKAGAPFSDRGRMQGFVDLGGGFIFQDSLPAKDSHLSQK